MSSDTWNPAQYERFKAERAQPFNDLLALVEPPRAADCAERSFRAVDLGCGTGELTARLHARLGEGGGCVSTLGLDSSPAILARAAQFSGPGLRFETGDIAKFATRYVAGSESNPPLAQRYDLLFSNAALQWLDDHAQLFPQLLRAVAPGGQFAAQMPCNQDHPAYALASEVASEPQFAAALGGYTRQSPVLTPEQYALLLGRAGFERQRVSLNVYLHRLSDRSKLLEWVRGTLLTDYEQRLSAADFTAYVQRYNELLVQRFADEQPYLFTFKRILLWGRIGRD